MGVEEYRVALAEYDTARKSFDSVEFKRLRKAVRDAAAPNHKGRPRSDFMSDYVACSCGWRSKKYWDLVEAAWCDWMDHVAESFGLTPRKCPCGKTYVPADGEKPCHALEAIP